MHLAGASAASRSPPIAVFYSCYYDFCYYSPAADHFIYSQTYFEQNPIPSSVTNKQMNKQHQ